MLGAALLDEPVLCRNVITTMESGSQAIALAGPRGRTGLAVTELAWRPAGGVWSRMDLSTTDAQAIGSVGNVIVVSTKGRTASIFDVEPSRPDIPPPCVTASRPA